MYNQNLRIQKVVLDGRSSSLVIVRSRVPEVTVLGSLMFLLYVKDIGDTYNHQ